MVACAFHLLLFHVKVVCLFYINEYKYGENIGLSGIKITENWHKINFSVAWWSFWGKFCVRFCKVQNVTLCHSRIHLTFARIHFRMISFFVGMFVSCIYFIFVLSLSHAWRVHKTLDWTHHINDNRNFCALAILYALAHDVPEDIRFVCSGVDKRIAKTEPNTHTHSKWIKRKMFVRQMKIHNTYYTHGRKKKLCWS